VTFEVEAGGTRRTIEVRPSREGWAITVDGRPLSVSLRRVDARWSLLYGEASLTAPRSYEVAFEPPRGDEQVVHVDGRRVKVSFVDRTRRLRGHAKAGGPGAREVVAPMPGRIVKVLVKPGDAVVANQGLVVVEAMKMENELRATRHGTVASVHVTEGVSVEANTVLVVVE
jgi:biotin carboxyl carrier protein